VSRTRVAAIAMVLALAGCATPTPREALPEAPLAFLYRTPAQGRDRADRLKSLRGEKKPSQGGVMKLNEVGEMVDHLRGARRDVSPELQGRIALFYPRSETLERLDAFLPGSIPCDWSDGHERLLAAIRHLGRPRLYEYSRQRRDLSPSHGARDGQVDGAYGPDGRIAYTEIKSSRDGSIRAVVWLTGSRGGRPRRLTAGPRDTAVRWSPDGHVVLFQSVLPGGTPVVEAIDVGDPSAAPRVLGRGREAAFSPSGDWVVYSRRRGDGWRLWRMRPDGSGKTAVGAAVQGDADERHPTVSPDGRFVAYVAEENDREQIRIRGMDGRGDRLLVQDGDGTLPIW